MLSGTVSEASPRADWIAKLADLVYSLAAEFAPALHGVPGRASRPASQYLAVPCRWMILQVPEVTPIARYYEYRQPGLGEEFLAMITLELDR